MRYTIDKADPPSLQETPSLPRAVRDESGSAPSNLSGWILWAYVGLILATLAALVVPRVWNWLERVRSAL